jgi:hypothetical protein
MHKGVGVGIEFLIQLSPRPTPFSDRKDDASSINCFRIVGWLVEKRESRKLHPSRRVASNISPSLGVVSMVALPGIFVRHYSRSQVWDRSERSMCYHFLRNVLRELFDLPANISQKGVARPSAD